jgi:hypothetical protein
MFILVENEFLGLKSFIFTSDKKIEFYKSEGNVSHRGKPDSESYDPRSNTEDQEQDILLQL